MVLATLGLVAATVRPKPALRTEVLPYEHLLLAEQPTLREAFRDGLAAALPGAMGGRDRRGLFAGSAARRRLRVFLDARALYADGTDFNPGTCFQQGQEYTLGVPPAAGQLCGGGTISHCTGTCGAGDVVTPARAAAFEALVRRVIEDFDFLDVPTPAVEAPLVLSHSTGIHASYYRAHGIADEVACARDCQLLLGWEPPPNLCADGLNSTDVVIALLATPYIPGVAASAGPCAYASSGRPLVAALRWHQPLPTPDVPLETLVAQHAGLLTHEVRSCATTTAPTQPRQPSPLHRARIADLSRPRVSPEQLPLQEPRRAPALCRRGWRDRARLVVPSHHAGRGGRAAALPVQCDGPLVPADDAT